MICAWYLAEIPLVIIHSPKGSWNYLYNFETSLLVFMPNITTNHAITYTYDVWGMSAEHTYPSMYIYIIILNEI